MQQAAQQLQGMFQDREPEPFGSAPGSAVPSQARRVLELCAGRRDQGFVTQPGSSTSTSSLGSYPSTNNLRSGDLEMKGVAKMSPNPTSARITTAVCGHIDGVTSAQVSPRGWLWDRGDCDTCGQQLRPRRCDQTAAPHPMGQLCSPRDLLLLNQGQGQLQPAAGKSWDVSAPHIPPTVAVPGIPAETKPRPGATRDQALLLCDASPGFRRRDNGTLQHQCTTPARIPKARVDTIQLLVEVF